MIPYLKYEKCFLALSLPKNLFYEDVTHFSAHKERFDLLALGLMALTGHVAPNVRYFSNHIKMLKKWIGTKWF